MSNGSARAFWIAEPNRGEIRDEPLPPCSAQDVLVRAMFSGISRGTESLVFRGGVPESERDRMRAPFQAGDFPAPVKYGYASVGEVVAGPPGLLHQRVFALHPHQTEYVVPADAVHVLPPHVPPQRAILAANLETAINGLWDASPRIGDSIAVIGAGTVGCLVAWLAGGIPGCDVELLDVNPRRAPIAAALGVRFGAPDTAPGNREVVVHASGSPDGLVAALRLAAFEGTIVDLSWYGDQLVPLPLGEAFHSRRLAIVASQVGTVAPARRGTWTRRRRMELALSLLNYDAVDVLLTGESDFEDLPRVMAQLAAQPGGVLCHRIRY